MINHSTKTKNHHFSIWLFAVYLIVMLLMSGAHTGLLVLMEKLQINNWVQTATPIVYWSIVATGLTLYTRLQVKRTYEEPMMRFAKATKQVASGDFSVYIAPLNTAEKHDYLDAMIMDFNTMVEELGSIETLKTDFVTNVSHEFKTPLAIIQNYSTLLQDETLTASERKEYIDTVIMSTQKLTSLVTNILKLNKIDNQVIAPASDSFDLCRQLSDCIIGFENFIDQKNIEIDVSIEDKATICADEELLKIVWDNLLSNALKFTPVGGKITLIQTSTANSITIKMADTGSGMDEETQRHIFDKFYQGDSSHSCNGNGLGLSLVWRIIQIHYGIVSVESEIDKGSVFIVTLPV